MKNQGDKKYLKGILKCLVFGVFFIAYSETWPFTIERPYPPEMAPFIPEIEKIVNDVLAEASEGIDNDPHGIIQHLKALDVTLNKDPNCEPRGTMWTNSVSTLDLIYVCQGRSNFF